MGVDGGGAEFDAVVGIWGGGTERVLRLGLSDIGSVARASHLLDWAVFYRFDFRLLVRSLVLRTLLYWAIVNVCLLVVSLYESYPA